MKYFIKNRRNRLSLGVILQRISIFVSIKNIKGHIQGTPEDPIIMISGFPLRIFEYPCCLLGNDFPPIDVWPPFFLNLMIWIIVSVILVSMFPSLFSKKYTSNILLILAGILTMIGIMHLVIMFD